MELEKLVSKMMTINTNARLWHWMTDRAQHHTTFEQFLTQNETFTDSFVESTLGNEISINLAKISVLDAKCEKYNIADARAEIKDYRKAIEDAKEALDKSEVSGTGELVTVLDEITELSSKSLYLLSLK